MIVPLKRLAWSLVVTFCDYPKAERAGDRALRSPEAAQGEEETLSLVGSEQCRSLARHETTDY